MTFKKIVGFGDSWMWGDELLDPILKTQKNAHPVLVENTSYRERNCFLGLLGEHYQVPVENFGYPGGSLQSSIWSYLWWRNNETLPIEDCLVLVALTDANRQSFYNPRHVVYPNDPPWHRFVHSSWVHSGGLSNERDWVSMVQLNTVLTQSPDLDRLNYQQTVLFFDGQPHTTIQFCVAPPPMTLTAPSLIKPTSCIGDHLTTAGLRCSGGHPNELGHAVIRDHLIIEIDRATIAQ